MTVYALFSVSCLNVDTGDNELIKFTIEFDSKEACEMFCDIEACEGTEAPDLLNSEFEKLDMPLQVDDCMECEKFVDKPYPLHLQLTM